VGADADGAVPLLHLDVEAELAPVDEIVPIADTVVVREDPVAASD